MEYASLIYVNKSFFYILNNFLLYNMKYLFSFLLLLLVIDVHCKNISPLDWGFKEAKTGIERYLILQKVHTEASNKQLNVDYSKMPPIIDLEIPINAKPIILTETNDFKGITICVKNKQKDLFLFARNEELTPIDIPKQIIDSGNFQAINKLKINKCILVIHDEKLWAERRGYDYHANRKDILLINKGKSKNKVIKPYNIENSSPKCFYRIINDESTIIKNLTIKRTSDSSHKTYAVHLSNLNDIVIEQLRIETPTNNLYGDKTIGIYNCTNIQMKDVVINGTYSQNNKYGYGINMDNVYHATFKNLNATANWGIFGTNNMNEVKLENCDINRFDIHCYGKNVYCKNTMFSKLYNQFSSFYGTLTFDKCHFKNFIPVLLESSYNAYTEFSLVMKNCTWDVDAKHNYLIHAGRLGDAPNQRMELSQKYLPSILIKNFKINISADTNKVSIIHPASVSAKNEIILPEIRINGLTFNHPQKGYEDVELFTSSKFFKLKGNLKYNIKRIKSNSKTSNRLIKIDELK